MKKEDYDSSIKKYSRRKALSKGWYLTKIAGGGILGGVAGNVIGRIYQTERDAIRDIMNYTKNQRKEVENDDEDYSHFNQALLLFTTGGIGLIISLIFISMSLSGYSVFGLENSFDKPIIGILIFIISLITILAGLREK